ncbi:hypothetical protein GAYE_SCF55G6320 [Galdieria yellowstonensis]|uniref:Uncharacterized protein n=1 Tax=Galdieria yellowstonensis TaxID=3028027 RepID=A0AAV9IM03_9RHOD|nr:hypothetical protein GAYE_SCF55G6320 [Galdieria yellowstonensis]
MAQSKRCDKTLAEKIVAQTRLPQEEERAQPFIPEKLQVTLSYTDPSLVKRLAFLARSTSQDVTARFYQTRPAEAAIRALAGAESKKLLQEYSQDNEAVLKRQDQDTKNLTTEKLLDSLLDGTYYAMRDMK